MHFGEPLDDERLLELLRTGRRHRHRDHRRRLRGGRGRPDARPGARGSASASATAWWARSVTTSTTASATARRASRASPTRACAARAPTATTSASPPSAACERCGVDRFDVLLLHNPDHVGYSSPAVWEGMRAVRDAGPAAPARRGARPGERLHARPDLLPGALLGADRLGDDHPQPARAVARGAGARCRRRARCGRDHPRGRLRRAVPRRRAAPDTPSPSTTTASSAPKAGCGPAARSWS